MRRVPQLIPLFAVVLVSLMIAGGVAQSTSAAAQAAANSPGTPVVPDPSECTVAPRSIDSLVALFREVTAADMATASASPAPYVPPTGNPADATTIAQITATFREFIACINGGDQSRVFAFLTDNKIRGDFAGDKAQGGTEAQLIHEFRGTPSPLPPASRSPMPNFSNQQFRVLPDGRVAVVSPDEVLIFVKQGDRWLIDEQHDLAPSGTPAP